VSLFSSLLGPVLLCAPPTSKYENGHHYFDSNTDDVKEVNSTLMKQTGVAYYCKVVGATPHD
jgi:hypothetical protein